MTIVKNNGLITTLDVFSGIGGITHGLKGIARPIAYCDNNDSSQKTLNALMKKG
jgi:site-specific DNA-cytosine methylase